jgi:putative restriction endonuclease
VFDRRADARFRAAAFEALRELLEIHGDVLPHAALKQGFTLHGQRVHFLGPQGIFKPAHMDVPLSISTIPSGPYDDGFDGSGFLHYRYRGTDPFHRDNVGLRFAMQEQLPLVYFHRVVPGKYVGAWPVFIVGDDPRRLSFRVQVDDAEHLGLGQVQPNMIVRDDGAEARRQYVTSVVRRRLHQRTFRERVLEAYRRECAFCRFRHEELLEAAHITPDSDPLGEPVVSNGLSLCQLHHGAFDRHFITLRPDHRIVVRSDLLDEVDGPTLVGIQSLQGRLIELPARAQDRPSVERLEQRYQEFLRRDRRVS